MTVVARVMEDQEIGCPDETLEGRFVSREQGTAAGEAARGRGFAGERKARAMEVPLESEASVIESPMDEEPVARLNRALEARIGGERFDLWFDRKTRMTVAGNSLVVEAGNAFAAQWIRGKFVEDLRAAAAEIFGRALEIVIRVEDLGAGAEAASAAVGAGASSAPAVAARCTPAAVCVINPKHTLEEFVVGPSNQMAYHAACRVAELPGKQFNPLFIHGQCGLGKTHLLQGICQRFAKLHPAKKWLYVTGEQFTNEFIEALRGKKTDVFRRRIRTTDLLVIDDVHFLANKKATQEEFLHTFNQVDGAGKQVVLASDCATKQIQALSEQLSSRFVSGMVLRVDSPDLPTRLEILRRRAARNGWAVSDAVLMHIAQSAASSVRELEGLLLQAVAGIQLINSGAMRSTGLTVETSGLLATLNARVAARGPVAVDRIVQAVAEYFAIAEGALKGSGREKVVSLARAIAMHLARQHTGMSFPEIGRAIGNKNHSTVIAACQRVEGLMMSGQLVCWNTPTGPRHQAVADALHELESTIRRR